jgi:hypothetical protein
MSGANPMKSVLAICLVGGSILWGSTVAAQTTPPPPIAEKNGCAECVPDCNKDHVYVYLVNGCTVLPHIYGSMTPAGPTLTEHGYIHNQTATHYFRWSFQEKIRRVHCCDPQARIVLVGFSMGSSVVHSMANTLEKEGISIALMVYLDGHTLVNDFHQRPCNVERIVCITSSAYLLRGHKVLEADYLEEIEDSRHLTVPKMEATLQLLLRELDAVAATVSPATAAPMAAPRTAPAPTTPPQSAAPARVVTPVGFEVVPPGVVPALGRWAFPEGR